MPVLKLTLASLLIIFAQLVGAVTTTTFDSPLDPSLLNIVGDPDVDPGAFVIFDIPLSFTHQWKLDVADHDEATISITPISNISNFQVDAGPLANSTLDPFTFTFLTGSYTLTVSGDALASDSYFVATHHVSQVPLPNSISLMLIALCGLLAWRKSPNRLKKTADSLMIFGFAVDKA